MSSSQEEQQKDSFSEIKVPTGMSLALQGTFWPHETSDKGTGDPV